MASSTSSVNLLSSGLDVASIVDQLMVIENRPVTQMQSQTSSMQTKISAFQSLNTKLSSLLNKTNDLLFGSDAAPLVPPYSFEDRLSQSIFALQKVESSDDSLIQATADRGTATGSYLVKVTSLAQAESRASANFADVDSTQTGSGTLTLSVGSNSPVIITIDNTNNTLDGVRKAINESNAGVKATIVNDGAASPYRLLITSEEAGTENSFTVTDGLSGGAALGLTELQTATDAQFSVNGMSITRSSNTVTDAIDGVTLQLKAKTTAGATLNISADKDSIVNSIKDLLSAYNAVNSYVNSQFTYNQTTKKAGTLSGDSNLRDIQRQLQSALTKGTTNRFTEFAIAGQVGIEFNKDGSLSLNETTFRSALNDDFTAVAALLLGNGTPANSVTASDGRISHISKTTATQAGTYAIEITRLGSQAQVSGNQVVTTLGQNETLTLTYGGSAYQVDLSLGDSLNTVLQKINSTLDANGVAASAADDGTGKIRLSTDQYGSSQTITVTSNQADAPGSTGFGITPVSGTGVDIAGTINGNAASGTGLTLSGTAAGHEEGLSFLVAQTEIGLYGSVTVASATEGEEGESILMNFGSLLKGITDPLTGPIQTSMDSLNLNIRTINDRIEEYQERLDVKREQLLNEYSQADQALKTLTVTQSSLSSQLASLSNMS